MLDTGIAPPDKIMSTDSTLLENLSAEALPTLHLYDWNGPSATYGYFINPADVLTEEAMDGSLLRLARRPTGGGVIFHLTDWAFSLLIPSSHPAYSVNTLENYAYVNHLVIEVIRQFAGKQAELSLLPQEPIPADPRSRHFCMAKPTIYDVMLEGRKVGGGAQRRTRMGILHQGTISLSMPEAAFLDRVLLPGTKVREEMEHHTCNLLGRDATANDIAEARKELSGIFCSVVAAL